jgi:hypothetical protein
MATVARYVDDYDGEYIVSGIVVKNGRRHQDRYWIPNSISNSDHKKVAFVVGNGMSRISMSTFRLIYLTKSGGGHLGKMKAQCYGCNAVYRDWTPDFLVCTNPEMIDDIVEEGYAENNVVFGRAASLLNHPEYISLIPHDPRMNCGATATYLACFHGHKKIYLLGFDNQTSTPGINNNVYAGTKHYAPKDENTGDDVWINNMSRVFNTYQDVEFVRVTTEGMEGVMPEQWKWHRNLRQIHLKKFFIEADI